MHVEKNDLRKLLSPACEAADAAVSLLPERIAPLKKVVAILKKLVADDETMNSFAGLINKLIDRGAAHEDAQKIAFADVQSAATEVSADLRYSLESGGNTATA